jgi:tetratricopeptide (TPR) repeat protein
LKDKLFIKWMSRFASGLTLGLIALGLMSQAFAQYQKTPRISHRSRFVPPIISPLLQPDDPRIHNAPPPLLDKGFIPVRASDYAKKPRVYIPYDSKVAPSFAGYEAGFYPVGYTPYLPAAIDTQSGRYQKALSYYNQGSHYGRINQLSEAIQAYQKAIQNNPHLADAYVGLSSAYLLKHGWEEVFLNAGKALNLKSGFIDATNITQAQFNLSMAYCTLAKSRKAYAFYKMVNDAKHPQREGLSLYLEKNCKR